MGDKNKLNKMAKIVITKELQDLVKSKKTINEVHFDKNGNHYLNVFKLQKNQKDTSEPQLYGNGMFSHMQLIPGFFNLDNRKEAISKGDPDSLIVATLTRDEILNSKVKQTGESLVSTVANMSAEDRKALKALLSETDEDEEE